jgi:hypothetical protein
MNEHFAVVQTTLEPLDLEKMSRAFRGIPGFAPYDAGTVCSEGDGILCRGFSANQAAALQANLQAEGVAVEVVDEAQLPVLPPAKLIRRVEIKPETIFIEDLVRGMIPVPCDQIRLIAAGSVQLTSFPRTRTEWEEVRTEHINTHLGISIPIQVRETKFDYSSKESVDWFLRAEILLADGSLRYCIEAERFNFSSLGDGVTRDLAGNFCLLVRGLAAHAPHALLNQGAAAIVSDPCEFTYYPRKGVFLDEITWMLWQAEQPGG